MQVLSRNHLEIAPPSPTLTNPEMILPYNISRSSTPSASPNAPPLPSALAPENDASVQRSFPVAQKAKREDKLDTPRSTGLSEPTVATTAVRYTGSDIRDTREDRRPAHSKKAGPLKASSPTSGDSHDRKRSSEASLDNFEVPHWEPPSGNAVFEAAPSVILEEEDEDPFSISHATMSIRAERILANAKKRLTTMENNLHRARTSLVVPTLPEEPLLSRSRNPKDGNLSPPEKGSSQGWNLLPPKHREVDLPSSRKQGHSRTASETSVPSSLHTSSQKTPRDVHIDRASSAMSSRSSGLGVRDSHSANELTAAGVNRVGGSGHSRGHSGRQNSSLQPVSEDSPAEFDKPNIRQLKGNSDPISSSSSSLNSMSSSANGLTRSRSTTQMRELRDQMQDLRGKVSSLKQRAREDSMRRRSLQSLRTPSPFTAAEQWYTETAATKSNESVPDIDTFDHPSREHLNSEIDEIPDPRIKEIGPSKVTEQRLDLLLPESQTRVIGREEGNHSQDFDRIVYSTPGHETLLISEPREIGDPRPGADPVQDEVAFSEPQVLEHSVEVAGERHEDRADAFDYENYFLHSSMGTYSKARRTSFSSTDSGETTKPAEFAVENPVARSAETRDFGRSAQSRASSEWQKAHSRQNSGQSDSTIATFATAEEGEGFEEEAVEDEWLYNRPMAGSWQTDYSIGQRRTPAHSSNHGMGDVSSSVATKNIDNGSPPNSASSDAAVASIPQYPPSLSVLISALSAAEAPNDGVQPAILRLSSADKELVENVAEGLARTCVHLHKTSIEENNRGLTWRKRLEQARAILDGDADGGTS